MRFIVPREIAAIAFAAFSAQHGKVIRALGVSSTRLVVGFLRGLAARTVSVERAGICLAGAILGASHTAFCGSTCSQIFCSGFDSGHYWNGRSSLAEIDSEFSGHGQSLAAASQLCRDAENDARGPCLPPHICWCLRHGRLMTAFWHSIYSAMAGEMAESRTASADGALNRVG